VLFVSLDTTRSDRLSVYGYAHDTTPALRGFARGATRFETAYSPTASTCSSHATLFTSLPPIENGVLRNGMRLRDEHETLAERLLAAGFQTAGFVSSFPLDDRFGLAQGFQSYDDDFPPAEATTLTDHWEGRAVSRAFDRRADHTTDRALRWLREARDPERPFFLFVHYFDPHQSYDPPEPFRTQYTARLSPTATPLERFSALYDGEIAFTDRELGRLLAAFDADGLAHDTLVVVFGDHGEGLMEHGFLGHGLQLYEPAVRIPLLVRWPAGLRESRSIVEPVSLIDVLPTVLDLLGLPADPELRGANLAPALRGEARLDPERPIFLYREPYERGIYKSPLGDIPADGEGFALRAGRWKYIELPGFRWHSLFDLERDPQERRNVAGHRPLVAARLAEQIEGWRREHRREISSEEISPADRRALEALGYIQ
jgi:arylsulfatase A-like enzyme